MKQLLALLLGFGSCAGHVQAPTAVHRMDSATHRNVVPTDRYFSEFNNLNN